MDVFIKSIPIEQESIHYDPDSSPLAWKHYSKIHTDEFFQNISFHQSQMTDFDEKRFSKQKFTRNNITYFRLIAKSDNGFQLGGDTCFNFKDDKIDRFSKIIGNSNYDLMLKLYECERSHWSLMNFSIMPVTGGMNNYKGSKNAKRFGETGGPFGSSYDRLDSLIFDLYEYYDKYSDSKDKSPIIMYAASSAREGKKSKKENAVILSNALKKYLDEFGDVHTYCDKIYNINDSGFIAELIKNGERPIIESRDVERYIKLAKIFWKRRAHSFYSIYNPKE